MVSTTGVRASNSSSHAVAIGGGMAGLLAGRVLADYARSYTWLNHRLCIFQPSILTQALKQAIKRQHAK